MYMYFGADIYPDTDEARSTDLPLISSRRLDAPSLRVHEDEKRDKVEGRMGNDRGAESSGLPHQSCQHTANRQET